MNSRAGDIVLGSALAMLLAIPMIGRADAENVQAVRDATVNFGQPQPQTPDPAPVGAAVTHFLGPNEVTILKGGTVTFVVNGGGHGIAIHRVSKNTTREDIAQDLCAGAMPEDPDPLLDRRNRNAVCNGTVLTTVTIDGMPVTITGTQNLDYMITDGKDNLVIDTGFNISNSNPRVDDTAHSERLLATSGRAPAGESEKTNANAAGAFLAGSAPPTATNPNFAPGNRVQVRFQKTGRYLVICMNRSHALNDHMFGFVNVVDAEGDK
jgi:plastocyanin